MHLSHPVPASTRASNALRAFALLHHSAKAQTMKPRHAAVFALVGWYLLTPPLSYFPIGSHDVEGKPFHGWMVGGWEENSPKFAEWDIEGTFDTAAECQGELRTLTLRVPQSIHEDREGYANALMWVQKRAECVSTDDPRLKPK